MYYPVASRIAALTTVRRERLLPVTGHVLVSTGEVVGSADVIARCQLPGQIHVLDVCRTLGIPRSRVARTMRKSVGDTVNANELLAAPRGPLGRFRKGCRSPIDGEVIEIRDGLILIETAPPTFELRAHVQGAVTNVMPNRGAVISVTGALIQGMWGSGGEAEGVLKMLVDTPQKPLRGRAIDVSCHGTIVVGGRIVDEEVFEHAVQARVRGIVAGGMDARLRRAVLDAPIPVMLTEGFGALPMSELAFDLLRSNSGRGAMLTADVRTRRGARRPELLIPLEGHSAAKEGSGIMPLQEGSQVRALRAPYLGAVGTVVDLPAQPRRIESGARLAVAVVELDGEQVQIPLANLELIL